MATPSLLQGSSARTLIAGDLQAVVLPDNGMLVRSLRYKGVEILRRVEDLEAAATRGSSVGIPLLYPWANRLAELQYRILGQEVVLDPSSPLLHFDENGLPNHGVPWPLLQWALTEARQDFIAAQLEWSSSNLLAVFPFRHRVELAATLRSESLTLETTVVATSECTVPISFGFHPYFGFSEPSRANWQLQLPPMRKLVLDTRGIPTGDEEPFAGFDAKLDESSFDDGFALIQQERAIFSVTGATCKVSVELLDGYKYAQVFAPKDKDYVALEPMTAPANALTSGRGLRFVPPGEQFRAAFRIHIDRM